MKNLYIFILFCSFFVKTSLSQSDDCGGAPSLTVGASCVNTAFTNNENNNEGTGLATCTAAGNDRADVWYQFTATSTSTTIELSSLNRNTTVSIYNSCPTAPGTYLTCIYITTGSGSIVLPTTITSNYKIRIQRRSGTDNNNLSGNICIYNTPSAPTNDNCGGAIALTAPSGVCASTAGTTLGATLSQAASASCASTNPDDDVWFTFNAPAAGSYVVQVDGATSFDAVLEVFSGICGSLTSLGCQNATGNDGLEALNVTVPSSGIYLVRVYHNGVGSSATPTFTICVVTPPANDNCLGAIPVPLTGCGAPIAGTSLNATQSQAGCSGTADDDVWYAITASATGTAQITVTPSASYNPVVQVFAGTCGALTSIQCVNVNAIGVSEVVSLTGLTSGQTYYIRVYHQGTGSGGNTFTICATDVIPCTIGTGDVTVNGALLPYNSGAVTTCGQINNITSSNVTNYCGSSYYYDGEDVVYNFIAPSSGQITIDLTSGGSYTNLSIHEGCPTAGGACIGSSQSSTGSKSVTICVTAGVRYYVVVDSWPSPDCNAYTLIISAVFGTGSSATNDQPCSATPMTLLVPASGNNACTGSANEPPVPTCWSTGNRNTVWYSIVAPASGQLRIKTIPSGSNPLQNTQFAVYEGVCGPGMTMIAGACNDDAPSCGGYSQYYSELLVTGLTSGNTYYIVVDGNGNSIGTFDILAIDGTTNFAAVPGQDCFPALPVCNGIMTTGNPGYQAIGGTCDHTGSGNCTSGEANSVWYEFTMATDDDVLFNIVPNDYGTPTNPLNGQSNPGYTGPGDETDYDWVLWKTSGTGSTTCAAIISSGGDGEQACNFDYLGVTGTSIDGTASSASYPASFDAAYEVAPFGNTGDVFLLVIQNFSNSTSGFTLEFPNPGSINFAPSTSLYWSGGANTANWSTQQNWGGCATPDCGRDAFILNSSSFQPVLAAGSYNVRDVTINPGATLTLQSGATLNVCGNFTNNGNLICQTGSVVNFIGTGVQNITGSFVGTDAFHHFTVTKTSGSVFLVNDITVNGDLTTSNNTSILNTNDKYIRLGGHFDNSNGNSTFSNTGTTGTLEFIGSGLQNYSQGSTQLDLNHVVLNNSAGFGAGVTLGTDMFIKSATGTLTLTLGTITTNANRVDVANSGAGSVSNGNTASFVDGNLRRSTLGTGTYYWPVGNVAKGYQLALTSFASNANPFIDARFDSWPGGFPIQGGSDCATTFSMDAMDNGYWTLAGDGSAATYDMSLFPLNVTNVAAGWTIMKQASYALTGWTLNGVCAASTAAQVNRNSMTNFSVFGIAQSPTPLPIELLYFEGELVGEDNLLTWATVSEQNNDYFTLERSRNGYDFEVLGTIAGAGTSTSILHYNHFDYDPFAGTSYYRLKQTDFDGQYIYSQTIALNRGMQHAVLSDLFPNPANNSVNFMMNTPKSGTVNVEMYDNSGRLIATQLFEAHVGSNSFNIDISYFAKGIYSTIIRFEHLEKEEITQLIKQ
jgi:hypothetical protein